MKALLFLALALLASCDFSPRIKKEIILAQDLMAQKRYDLAIKKFERILENSPSEDVKIKIKFQLGELYSINNYNMKKAISYFELIKKNTQDPLWVVKAEEKIASISYEYLKNYERSYSSFKNLSNFEPKLAKYDYYHYMTGLSLIGLKKFKNAKEVFSEIMEQKRHSYRKLAIYQMGITEYRQGNWEKSIKYFKEYISKSERQNLSTQAKFLMANAYETLEDLKMAYNIYYSLLAEYPQPEIIKNRLNAIYERKVSRKR